MVFRAQTDRNQSRVGNPFEGSCFDGAVISSDQRLLTLAWVQSAYYTLTGVWPLVDVTSFMWVTGPKVDVWLVRTVAGLLVVTGLALGFAAKRKQISVDLAMIAAGQALVLCIIDVVYPLIGRISPIYLLDALPEAVLVALWLAWYPRPGKSSHGDGAV